MLFSGGYVSAAVRKSAKKKKKKIKTVVTS